MITRRRKLYRLTRRMPRPTNFPFCAHCVASFSKSLAATWAGHDPQGMKTVVPKVPFQRGIVGVMEPSMDKKVKPITTTHTRSAPGCQNLSHVYQYHDRRRQRHRREDRINPHYRRHKQHAISIFARHESQYYQRAEFHIFSYVVYDPFSTPSGPPTSRGATARFRTPPVPAMPKLD